MYVCLSEKLWQLGDFKNGRIWLKFCTLVPWVNIRENFFHLSKILIFEAWERVLSQYEAKALGEPGDFKNGRIWLKFGTLVPCMNTWECVFHFQNLFLCAWKQVFVLKRK